LTRRTRNWEQSIAAHDQALAAHAAALAPIADMGRALEGLAARIDRLDALLAEPPGANGAAVAPPAAEEIALPAPPRQRPQPSSFPRRDGRLRILGVNDMFPLISETYIREELLSLVGLGADVAWFRHTPGPAPMPVAEPVFDDFDAAIRTVSPDVAIVHWVTTAHLSLPLFERHQLPFGVRGHSFDFDRERLGELLAHPLCIGAWTFPSSEYRVEGAHSLAPIVSPELPRPRAVVRDKVVSLSAGLPKKDWPLLLEAFDLIDGADRRLVLGVTIDHEDTATALLRACQGLQNPPLVQVNTVREDVFELLSKTALVIYTLRPDARFGMPMSIADALCAGCSVVVPDRPEALQYAGPDARPYGTAAEIAAHAAQVLAGGEAIEAEWERNRVYGAARFCDPQVARRFDAQLREGLTRVRTASA
jgi:glycosyltransferase involved in cell wall biosynthesis